VTNREKKRPWCEPFTVGAVESKMKKTGGKKVRKSTQLRSKGGEGGEGNGKRKKRVFILEREGEKRVEGANMAMISASRGNQVVEEKDRTLSLIAVKREDSH